ncbi:flavodoxin family protein [Paraburkholderia phenoliruptrix]|uniref:flavodoxin family protein n=1 Tax=Paraburkholderia phenoliruptrix TaxID=252970 RepID=UPI001C6F013C|nr:flavodoxin [Paraburkholderia phenoliruptrix]MBW9105183.1 flavodoxin [Paraburkholderia phenoliruptrix]MBW9129829.1 flavodoxin [Paraburkholderia ginsengiterrae]
MSDPRVLIVFFSRTGTTRRLATALAGLSSADVEEICDYTERRGASGYLHCVFDSWRKRPAEIVPTGLDPSQYDLVVIGTPVWAGAVSAPVRAYLLQNRSKLRHVAFFCTLGGLGAEGVFDEMRALAGKAPVAQCKVRAAEIEHGVAAAAFEAFAATLKQHLAHDRALEWVC